MVLSALAAVTAYARVWNQLDAESLSVVLSDDICYATQCVFQKL